MKRAKSRAARRIDEATGRAPMSQLDRVEAEQKRIRIELAELRKNMESYRETFDVNTGFVMAIAAKHDVYMIDALNATSQLEAHADQALLELGRIEAPDFDPEKLETFEGAEQAASRAETPEIDSKGQQDIETTQTPQNDIEAEKTANAGQTAASPQDKPTPDDFEVIGSECPDECENGGESMTMTTRWAKPVPESETLKASEHLANWSDDELRDMATHLGICRRRQAEYMSREELFEAIDRLTRGGNA